ncbi:MAG: hypothetical protein IPH28_25165 [Cytophagaceae bacterium]|nr:hypothetical protein [Cytophagaceae bacterium]
MKGVELFFPKQKDDDFIHSNCFIGINGSGKSQILEIIAEIYLFLDMLFNYIIIMIEKLLWFFN